MTQPAYRDIKRQDVSKETPNNQTLFLYLIEGTLAADDAMTKFEEGTCRMGRLNCYEHRRRTE